MNQTESSMSADIENRKNPQLVGEFNSAAEGIESKDDMSAFSDAANRIARDYAPLLNRAENGFQRAEVIESMAGVLNHIAQRNFDAQLGLRNYETITRAVRRLGDMFITSLRPDTVPEFYTTDQVDYLSGLMKSAARIREDMADYFPDRPNSAAIAEQGAAFRRLSEDLDRVSKAYGGGELKSSRPRRGGDRPVRSRF